MGSMGGPGIALSLLFVMVLFGEIYYILFWRKKRQKKKKKKRKKKKIKKRETEKSSSNPCFFLSDSIDSEMGYRYPDHKEKEKEEEEDEEEEEEGEGGGGDSPSDKGFISKCFSSGFSISISSSSSSSSSSSPLPIPPLPSPPVPQVAGGGKENKGKVSKEEKEREIEDDDDKEEEWKGILPGMLGPPRLLFTIAEETWEEMEVVEEGDKASNFEQSIRPTSTIAMAMVSPLSPPPSSNSFGAISPPSASGLSPFAAMAIKPLLCPSPLTLPTPSPPSPSSKLKYVGKDYPHHFTTLTMTTNSTATTSSSSSSVTTPFFSPCLEEDASSLPPSPSPPPCHRRTPLKYLFEKSPLQTIASPCSSSSSPLFSYSSSSSNLPTYNQYPSSSSSLCDPSPRQRGPLRMLFQQPSPPPPPLPSSSHCFSRPSLNF